MIYQRVYKNIAWRYNGSTGLIYWLADDGTWVEQKLTVSRNGTGSVYLQLKLDKNIHAHKLAMFIVSGKWSTEDIDHIDRNGLNNKLDNLRTVSRAVNNYNSGVRKDNASGVKGVFLHSKTNSWRAHITINKKTIVKYASTFEEACKLRKQLEEQYQNIIQLPKKVQND